MSEDNKPPPPPPPPLDDKNHEVPIIPVEQFEDDAAADGILPGQTMTVDSSSEPRNTPSPAPSGDKAPAKGFQKMQAAVQKVNEARKVHTVLEMLGAADSKEDLAKRDTILKLASMKQEQQILRDNEKKQKVLYLLYFIVYLDFLGMMLMTPVGMDIFSEKVDATQEERDAGYGQFAKETSETLGSVTIAILVGPALNGLGGFFASMMSGMLVAKFGKRGALLIFTFGGAIAFVANYFSKDLGLWGYFAFRFVVGLFGGSRPIVNMYIAELYTDPLEMMKKMGTTTTIMMAALGSGPIVGSILIQVYNLFFPLIGAAVAEFIAGVLVLIYIPKVKAQAAGLKKGAMAAPTPPPQPKTGWKQWVYLLWLARFLDNAAAGLPQHFQTAAVVEFPELQQKMIFALLLGAIGMAVWVSMKVAFRLMPKYGLAWMGVIGQFGNAVGYLLLSFAPNAWLYSIFLLFTAVMMTIAGMAIGPTLIGLVPPDRKDSWIGFQAAVVTIQKSGCPFILITILANEKGMGGSDAFQKGFFMQMNCIVALVSCIPYLVLTKKFPKPVPKKVVPEEEEEAMRVYKETGDRTWLTAEQNSKLWIESLSKGEPLPLMAFGTFEEDKPNLERIRTMAQKDFEFHYKDFGEEKVQRWEKASEEERNEMRKRIRVFAESPAALWPDEEKQDFGKWVADWLEYAGYGAPGANTRAWKAMVMTAFPLILEGGFHKNEDFIQDPTPVWIKVARLFKGFMTMDKITRQQCTLLMTLPTASLRMPAFQ